MKFIPCDKCKNEVTPGFFYNGKALVPCECRKEWQRKTSLLWKLREANILQSEEDFIWEYSLSKNYMGENKGVFSLLEAYLQKPETFFSFNYYLHGEALTQKTTIAKWVGKVIVEKYTDSVYYITMEDLLNKVSNLKKEKEQVEEIKSLEAKKLLIIDDAFDTKRLIIFKNSFHLTAFYNFILQRTQQAGKSTMFVAPCPIDKISEEHFSNSIKNILMHKNTIILQCKDNINREKAFIDLNAVFASRQR